jgi:tRNA(Ile)-lysidine synthase
MRPCVGRLVRPLLEVTRAQTEAYCRARGLAWREDETNLGDRYARGRMRAGLLPALRAIHPAAEANVVRTAQLLREEADVLDALVEAEVGDDGSVAIARLAVMPPAVGRLVVLRLAEDAAGRPAPDAGRRLAEIVALAQRRPEASLDLEGGVRALISDGRLRFGAVPPPAGWRRWRAARDAGGGLRARLSRRPG